MAVSYLGRGAFVYMGEESTWGVSATKTVYNRLISVGMKREQQREGKNHLTTSTGAFALGFFDAFEIAGGPLVTEGKYDGSGILIYAALGSLASVASGAMYDHTFSPSSALPSLTIQVQRGSGTMEEFTGCMVASMELSIEAGSQMEIAVEIIAKTSAARTTAITGPNFGSGLAVNHYESGTLSFNGVTYDLRSLSFNLENSLERRNLLGSKLTSQPAITDRRVITLECTADYENDNLYNAQIAGTQSNAVISFTNSAGHQLEITLNDAVLISMDDTISSVGRIETSFSFEGFADATNKACKIMIKNGSSNGIANG